MILPLLLTLPATLLVLQSSAPPREVDRFFEKASPWAEERAKELLSKVEAIQQPELRFVAIRDLASLGESAIPMLEKAVEGGNHEKARVALFALSWIRTAASKEPILRLFSGKADLDLQVVALLGAAGHRDAAFAERVLGVLQSRNADLYVRLVAATAASVLEDIPAESLAALLQQESISEIAGSIAIALGRNGGESAIAPLQQALITAKDPALRAGLWIGLTFAGATANEEMALRDLSSKDPVLSASAAMALAEIPIGPGREIWEKAFRSGDPWFRSACLEGICRGQQLRSRAFLLETSQTERHPQVRKALLRAVLRRQDYGLAFSVRKNRAGESLGGYWALGMALLTLDGVRAGSSVEGVSRALHELVGSWDDPREPFPRGTVFWLAAAGGREEEGYLLAIEKRDPQLADVARMGRKFLRGEMDHRSFREEVRKVAEAEGLLPGQGLFDLQNLYSSVLLGGGSRFFENRPGFPNSALLHPGEKRKPRPIPAESAFYEDLWYWFEAGGLQRR